MKAINSEIVCPIASIGLLLNLPVRVIDSQRTGFSLLETDTLLAEDEQSSSLMRF
jgi:hypothetical protein